MGYIYKISNDINDKVYIGQTRQPLHQRWSMHKQHSKTKPNLLYRAMRKYGIEHFSIEIIEECDENLLNEREVYWINFYDSYHRGYNMTIGGEQGSDGRPPIFQEQILSIYTQNPQLSFGEIAQKVGCTVKTVSVVLNSQGKESAFKKHSGIPVQQLSLNGDFIQEYHSAREAVVALGKNPGCGTSILNVCKQKPGCHTAYGYKWKFKE